jgi:hypothetical protein
MIAHNASSQWEAVPGSSPGRSLNSFKRPLFALTESLSIKEGLAGRADSADDDVQQ